MANQYDSASDAAAMLEQQRLDAQRSLQNQMIVQRQSPGLYGYYGFRRYPYFRYYGAYAWRARPYYRFWY